MKAITVALLLAGTLLAVASPAWAATPKAVCWNGELQGPFSRVESRKTNECGLLSPDTSSHYLDRLHWSTWNAKIARGEGRAIRQWPKVRVTLSQPKRRCGALVFTRAKVAVSTDLDNVARYRHKTTCSARTARAGKTAKRCGTIRRGAERQGIYIVRGHMSCATVKRFLRRLERAYRDGTTTSIDNNVSYFKGYYCGGRMGYYFCQDTRPYNTKPTREFLTRSCAPATPGCPARITDA
jgi:hypothetical protein